MHSSWILYMIADDTVAFDMIHMCTTILLLKLHVLRVAFDLPSLASASEILTRKLLAQYVTSCVAE